MELKNLANLSDEMKVELLNSAPWDLTTQLEIIEALESDEIRKELFERIPRSMIPPGNCAAVILSFKSEDMRIKLHNKYEDMLSAFDRAKIVLSLEADDKKLALLENYKDETFVRNWILAELQKDKTGGDVLFKSDDVTIRYLDKMQAEGLNNYSGFTILISSIQSDDTKIAAYEKYKSNFLKDAKDDIIGNSVIRSIKSDEKKIQTFYQYMNEIPDAEKIQIIRSIKSVDKRIKLANQFINRIDEQYTDALQRDLLKYSIEKKHQEAKELTQMINNARERDGKLNEK